MSSDRHIHHSNPAGSPLSIVIQEDFPRNELEFHNRFHSEEECRKYFFKLRWPNGFVCPHCGHNDYWPREGRDTMICAGRACGKEVSLRSGTVLHNSPKPLRAWLLAMYHMTTSKRGLSALELQGLMEFGCYRTALRWLRELRRAMSTVVTGHKLGPEVEADETLIGGREENGKRGMGTNKACVVGVVEKRAVGSGRVRLKLVDGLDHKSIRDFVADVTAPGSLVCSDGKSAYLGLMDMGFYVDSVVTTNGRGKQRKKAGKKAAESHLPRIHRVFSLLKRVLMGTHHGACSTRHLQLYLDEYSFRFARRNDTRPLATFQRLATTLWTIQAVPYWKSSGRVAPDKETKKRPAIWKTYGGSLLTSG